MLSIALGVGLFIISTALFSTVSRGGIVIWLVLLPILLWAGYTHTRSKRLVTIIPLIAILAYVCSVLLFHSNVADRTFQLTQDGSTGARLLLWQSTIKMALAHPVIGTGWGTFTNYYPAYRDTAETGTAGFFAHNDYLQLAAEGGIFALLLQLGVLFGLLFQLKQSLKRAAEVTGLESIALLLGVLAIYIHAGVNFILYFAFMNILAGLYLARVAQLSGTAHIIKLPSFEEIGPSVKRLLKGFIVLLIAAPFAISLISAFCLTGTQRGLKAINFFAPKVTAFDVADLITSISPKESIAQEFVISTFESILSEGPARFMLAADARRELFNDVIKHFELVRTLNANNANMGLREALVVLKQMDILGVNIAYAKAHQILWDNLKADPFHTGSSLQLAHLQILEGHRDDALSTLQRAKSHALQHVEEQLITITTLRILAAPRVIAELDKMEKQIRVRLTASAEGRLSGSQEIDGDIFEERIKLIAEQVQQEH
jgi:hypothetical protein